MSFSRYRSTFSNERMTGLKAGLRFVSSVRGEKNSSSSLGDLDVVVLGVFRYSYKNIARARLAFSFSGVGKSFLKPRRIGLLALIERCWSGGTVGSVAT